MSMYRCIANSNRRVNVMRSPAFRNRREELEAKIKLLNRTTWERRAPKLVVDGWVAQFEEDRDSKDDEQLHALFLLSNFLYFGLEELRSLLRALYRDFIRSPAVQQIRRANGNTLDLDKINAEYTSQRSRMRFLGLGSPAESSALLLYFFRQENSLPRDLFISPEDIFEPIGTSDPTKTKLREPSVNHYVFIDDLCGSGTQARRYSRDIVGPLKALSGAITVDYYVLFATSRGLRAVEGLGVYDTVRSVYELDDSFRILGSGSRLFGSEVEFFERAKIRKTCEKYGKRLWARHPLGYKDGQLLLGFNYNTPDNTLPIFWRGDEWEDGPWKPVFKRYDKVY